MTRISFRRHRYSRASWRLGSCRSAAKIFHSFEKYLVSKSPLIRTSQLIQFLVSVVWARLGTRRNGACLPTQSPWQLQRTREIFSQNIAKIFLSFVTDFVAKPGLSWPQKSAASQGSVRAIQYTALQIYNFHRRHTTSDIRLLQSVENVCINNNQSKEHRSVSFRKCGARLSVL